RRTGGPRGTGRAWQVFVRGGHGEFQGGPIRGGGQRRGESARGLSVNTADVTKLALVQVFGQHPSARSSRFRALPHRPRRWQARSVPSARSASFATMPPCI